MASGDYRKQILIVDDEADITRALKKGIEAKGLGVDTYNVPTEAIMNFKPDLYDIAILDIRMPEMSGFDLYRELKKRDKNLAFCFFTAFDILPSEFERMFPDSSVKAFIKKPVSISQLLVQLNLVADG
ncbi:MAG: response regulator, partial [Thaumarchaeota archaeon]|nr:response regulator [Nitrososphaerota archaeon]